MGAPAEARTARQRWPPTRTPGEHGVTPEGAPSRPVSHDAVVYDGPLELVRAIGAFATSALGRGGAVVLIARREHLDAAAEWIRLSRGGTALGVGAAEGGRYQLIDADEVIAGLTPECDPVGAFEALLEHACRSIPPDTEVVHVYGELVGRLRELGQMPLALAIEEIGSRLARDRGVSVLCAYPADVARDTAEMELIRRCHTNVLTRSSMSPSPNERGEPERPALDGLLGRPDPVEPQGTEGPEEDAVLRRAKVFPASIPACRAARHFVREAVEDSGNGDELADAAELICSELAANAVRHAHSVFTVRVACDSGGVRVSVADETRPSPTGLADDGSESFPVRAARGLGIVSALASDWGVDDQLEGKVVWAELGRTLGAA